jgi:hypothetical protein
MRGRIVLTEFVAAEHMLVMERGQLSNALTRSRSRVALDGLGDVAGGVLGGVADLTDDTLVGLVGVGSRHVDGWVGRLFVCRSCGAAIAILQGQQ